MPATTYDYAGELLSWQSLTDVPSSALTIQEPLLAPAYLPREQPGLMLANPSSLALSLVAIATLATTRFFRQPKLTKATTGAHAEPLQRPRRRVA